MGWSHPQKNSGVGGPENFAILPVGGPENIVILPVGGKDRPPQVIVYEENSVGGWSKKNCNSASGWSDKNCNSVGGWSEKSSVVTPTTNFFNEIAPRDLSRQSLWIPWQENSSKVHLYDIWFKGN